MKDITREWICDIRLIDDVIARTTPKSELIRCKDCKKAKQTGYVLYCKKQMFVSADDYCSWAERKEE